MSEIVTMAEITCQTCGKFGCKCEKALPDAAKARREDACPVCKRSKLNCLCASLPPESLAAGVELGDAPPMKQHCGRWSAKQVDLFVREAARAFYSERDWNTVERIIREAAS